MADATDEDKERALELFAFMDRHFSRSVIEDMVVRACHRLYVADEPMDFIQIAVEVEAGYEAENDETP